ncbi:hypothetical protein MAV3388_10890 [Mycobacterium avium subsp. hominissuis 3388]|nr:hypothetical protein O984_23725 [Mycobacterium avium 05-4293]KDO99501.1 hypothetical protein MAV3388_10890 [Mycobacterium avium subsp. hominissuis 3388]
MAAARRAALTFLSARFSFNDFPDFLLMARRGDLSDIAGPFVMGAWSVPILRLYPTAGIFGRRGDALAGVSSKELEIQAVRTESVIRR